MARFPKPTPKQFAETTFDVSAVGAVAGLLLMVWTLGAVWAFQLTFTCLVVGLLAALAASRLNDGPQRPQFRAPRTVRRDTVSGPVAETDEAQDRWAGVDLEEAMDRVEAEEEAQQPVQ